MLFAALAASVFGGRRVAFDEKNRDRIPLLGIGDANGRVADDGEYLEAGTDHTLFMIPISPVHIKL